MATVWRVGYQGEPGAYSEAALAAWFGEEAAAQPCTTFAEVVERLTAGYLDAAVLPVENSYAGDVGEVYDLFWRHPVLIHGEITLPVRHCLLGVPGATMAEVRQVRSHPQGLAQCRDFLRSHNFIAEPVHDTAAAARMVAEAGQRHVAAIASARSSVHYDVEILAENIQDHADNTTRFYVLTVPQRTSVPAPVAVRRQLSADGDPLGKTCLIFAVKNVPGALHQCLGIFAAHEVNLTKLTSRPYPGEPWHYMFIADLAGRQEDAQVASALSELADATVLLRILGSFPTYAVQE